MSSAEDLSALEQDDQMAEPLRRVAYEAGMMLGLEATRDEQAYPPSILASRLRNAGRHAGRRES